MAKTKKITNPIKVKNRLEQMNVGDTLVKDTIIKEIWGSNNYFIRGTFDVVLYKVRKELNPKLFKILKRGILTSTA